MAELPSATSAGANKAGVVLGYRWLARGPARARTLPRGWAGIDVSECPADALSWGAGPIVARVALSGELFRSPRRVSGRDAVVLWTADATTVLGEWMLWISELSVERRAAQAIAIVEAEREAVSARLAVERAALLAIRRWLVCRTSTSVARQAVGAARRLGTDTDDRWWWRIWDDWMAVGCWTAWAPLAASWFAHHYCAIPGVRAELERRLLALAPPEGEPRCEV